jgi:hypothetical protein
MIKVCKEKLTEVSDNIRVIDEIWYVIAKTQMYGGSFILENKRTGYDSPHIIVDEYGNFIRYLYGTTINSDEYTEEYKGFIDRQLNKGIDVTTGRHFKLD